MMNDKRKFAIAYNGSDPYKFLERLEPYKEHVDHIYLGIIELFDTHRVNEWGIKDDKSKKYNNCAASYIEDLESMTKEEYDYNCFAFLEITKKGPYKRLLVMNRMLWNIESDEFEKFCIKCLKPVVEQFNIQGVIISEFEFASIIRKIMPNIEIHLSLCSSIMDISSVLKWHQFLNISSFNIPQSFSRRPLLLKELKQLGIPLKMLVNEDCICGCPMKISHRGYMSRSINHNYKIYCDSNNLSEVFQSCFILPRHLKQFDDLVDVFKISTRRSNTDRLFKTIDYYINEIDDETDAWEILAGRMFRRMKLINKDHPEFHMPINKIPDKLIFCECKECLHCDKCKLYMKKLLGKELSEELSNII